ncbi:MAG TPA: ABC transporter permease [Micromonosporaceae bacterium]|nr:ABC transporter permease [Micromonosporaceae bacterium]HCU50965.1 ABC transporter permease [Micromonosporaceae bacterium]
MLKAMLRGLFAHKLRLVLSALAIILGTAFMAAAFVGGDTISKGFTDLFSTVNKDIDVQVTGKSDVPGMPGGGGESLVTVVVPQSVADRLKTVDGAARVTPQVASDGARVIGKDGKVVASTGAPRFGGAWPADPSSDSILELREGAGPVAPDQVVLSANLARSADVKVGDHVEIITLQPRQKFTVTGIAGVTGGRDSLGGETFVYFTQPVAQELMLGQTDVYSNVDIKAAPGVPPDELKKRVEAAVGDGYKVLTGKESSEAQASSIQGFLTVFSTGLAVFGFLALFTGAFLIFNTFSMLIAQRTRELALYRSFGADKGQVLRSVLLESVILGLVASLIGLVIGIGLGWLLKWALGAISGSPFPGSGVVVRPVVIIGTLLAGTLITLLAALFPALRASRVAPIEAMREAARPDRPMGRLTSAGLVLLAAGIVLLIFKGTKTIDNNVITLGGGTLLTFIGAVLIAPALSRPVTAAIGKLVDWAVPGRLGVRNTGRNPRRTALTAAALMIGVTLATGAGVFASSLKSGLTNLFQQDLDADLMLQTDFAAGPTAGFDPALTPRLQQIPGVAAATALQQDAVRMADRNGFAAATDAEAAKTLFGIKPKAGEVRRLNQGEVLLNEAFANESGLKVGDTTTMKAARGDPVTLKVIGILEPNQLIGSPLISPLDASGFRSALAQQAYVKVNDPSQLNGVRDQMKALIADNPEVTVTDPSAQLKQATSFLDLMLTVLNVLLGLTLLVAILGVINTLLLSVFERTRELGLLRAIGMNRSKMGWMITVEAVLISLFGALLGMVLGTALGVTLVKIFGGDFLKLTIPWGYLIITLIAAIIAGLLAALLPAIRAARLNVLEAISYE